MEIQERVLAGMIDAVVKKSANTCVWLLAGNACMNERNFANNPLKYILIDLIDY